MWRLCMSVHARARVYAEVGYGVQSILLQLHKLLALHHCVAPKCCASIAALSSAPNKGVPIPVAGSQPSAAVQP
eukprot:COSAG02_NODE_260_length_26771_cov_3110.350817_10_plen_74_part_00